MTAKKSKTCEFSPHLEHCLDSLMALGKLLSISDHPISTQVWSE